LLRIKKAIQNAMPLLNMREKMILREPINSQMVEESMALKLLLTLKEEEFRKISDREGWEEVLATLENVEKGVL
jgi:hypothetical protein